MNKTYSVLQFDSSHKYLRHQTGSQKPTSIRLCDQPKRSFYPKMLCSRLTDQRAYDSWWSREQGEASVRLRGFFGDQRTSCLAAWARFLGHFSLLPSAGEKGADRPRQWNLRRESIHHPPSF